MPKFDLECPNCKGTLKITQYNDNHILEDLLYVNTKCKQCEKEYQFEFKYTGE